MNAAAAESGSATPQAWLSRALRAAGLLLAVAPFLPPLFAATGHPALAETFDAPWVSTCHRLPERSLSIAGKVMPICSRCLGLVEGLGLGLLLGWPYRDIRTLRITLSIAAAFLFVELTTQDLGWHPVFHPTRLLSGFLCSFPIGAAAGALAKRLAAEPAAARPAAQTTPPTPSF